MSNIIDETKNIKKPYSICLNMIVKNESHVIESTLENIIEKIPITHYFISDTGSTDNTIEIINNFFNKHNIQGNIYQDEWKDFGYNRTLALEHAFNKTDYLLIFDADDKINGDFKLPQKLNKDAYYLKFGNIGCQYKRHLLINNRIGWKFVGVLHEYLSTIDEQYKITSDLIEGSYYIDSGKTGDRSKDPEKYKKDAVILENAYHKASGEGNKLKIRYSFYCAQSYRDSNQKEKAIEWYKKRVDYGDWNQEVYFSLHQIGKLYMDLNEYEKAIYYWSLSVIIDDRYECLYEIISFFRRNNKPNLAFLYYKMILKFDINKSDKLFLFNVIYDYLLDYELIHIAHTMKEYRLGITTFNKLFINQNILSNASLQLDILRLFQYYIDYLNQNDKDLIKNYFNFVQNIYLKIKKFNDNDCNIINKTIDKIKLFHNNKLGLTLNNNINNNNNINVLLSITTCKRYDLFEKTINSILYCFNDLNKIDYFLCIDDNSSAEDRKSMLKNYPFFKYQFKKQDNKGHLSSMNMIWDKLNELKPKYWIHLEDDWLFFKPDNYVSKSISFLEKYKKDNIHQILFNKNYAEIIQHYDYVGGSTIDNNYILHIKDEEGLNSRNCSYWPHYSFRPSMVLTETILKLGNYSTTETFFERVYADKYYDNGYKSAFWNEVTCIHIGRLTSERFDSSKKNAYQLNCMEQFDNNPNNNNQINNNNNPNNNNNNNNNNNIKYSVINENYILLKSLDNFGDDVEYINNKSIDELIEISDKNENIICFNTLGYLKHSCNLGNLMNFHDESKGLIIHIKRFNNKYGIFFN